MITVTPVLHFNGQCEEAITLYQKAFGARIDSLLHYSDRDKHDWDIPLTPTQESYVYHAEVYIDKQRIMMADNHEPDLHRNTSTFFNLTFETAEEVKAAYAVLVTEGTVLIPMHSTTYSSCMVSVVDKFGVRWGLMTEQTKR